MRGHPLIEIADRRAQREDARAEYGREAQIMAPEGRQRPTAAKPRLAAPTSNWNVVGPANELGGQLAEEHVHDEVIEIVDADADAEEDVPGEELFDHKRPVDESPDRAIATRETISPSTRKLSE